MFTKKGVTRYYGGCPTFLDVVWAAAISCCQKKVLCGTTAMCRTFLDVVWKSDIRFPRKRRYAELGKWVVLLMRKLYNALSTQNGILRTALLRRDY